MVQSTSDGASLPFSRRGKIMLQDVARKWVKSHQERYGLSWQVILADEGEMMQKITPALLFVGEVCGKAEEAINFYAAVFSGGSKKNKSEAQVLARYGKGEEPD